MFSREGGVLRIAFAIVLIHPMSRLLVGIRCQSQACSCARNGSVCIPRMPFPGPNVTWFALGLTSSPDSRATSSNPPVQRATQHRNGGCDLPFAGSDIHGRLAERQRWCSRSRRRLAICPVHETKIGNIAALWATHQAGLQLGRDWKLVELPAQYRVDRSAGLRERVVVVRRAADDLRVPHSFN